MSRIHKQLLKLSHPQGEIIEVKIVKSQLIGHYYFFPAIIELVRKLVINNMHNKSEEDTCKTFELIVSTR